MSKTSYRWIIIILSIIIICILTAKMGNNEYVLNYISFAGILISIILATIAIIYSYYQNSTFQSSLNKIDDSAQKMSDLIEQVEDNFKNLENGISKLQVLEEITSNLQQVSSVTENVKEKTENIESQIQEIVVNSNNMEEQNRQNISYSKEQIREIVYTLPQLCITYVYSLIQFFNYGKKLNVIDFVSYITNDKSKYRKNGEAMYLTSIIVCYQSVGLLMKEILHKGDELIIKINDFNKDFSDIICEEVDIEIKKDPEFKKEIDKINKYINS